MSRRTYHRGGGITLHFSLIARYELLDCDHLSNETYFEKISVRRPKPTQKFPYVPEPLQTEVPTNRWCFQPIR